METQAQLEQYSENDFRIRISKTVGFKPSSMLKKNHLNSIYTYMKGEFLIDPDNIHQKNADDWVSLQDMRLIIAALFDIEYDEHKYNQPSGPKFNKHQLRLIYEGLKQNEDQRHWL